MSVLAVQDLRVGFRDGTLAVRGISLDLGHGETLGLVGESGCGKSVTSLAVMGLLARGAARTAAGIRLAGEDIARASERRMAQLRGDRIAMIFQEPMTSLNPAYTVGDQLSEVYRRHRGAGRLQARDRAADLLARVGIANPGLRLAQYPHELSGGLRQRVMIAMALMCEPDVLIADEPTTALDVTVQAQILRLLQDLQKETGLAILLITHDLGVVARMADRVSVMYAGEIVESGTAEALFGRPMHPYTRGLLDSIPVPGKLRPGDQLKAIPGTVPRITAAFRGCGFRDRCGLADRGCEDTIMPREEGPQHRYLCRLSSELQGQAS
ncbi:ABC transporter ATP-binding protein [uncultured Alsobacter sp.]|uniref:ABC transporter ATP-binding protein n=1 Tax=uncultured Alsobacter sp. TaxID=1748258 RepID=UPI0025CCB444|nr:ABC transporter ATP-binding protein [uncultured Alsobacter sp.]